MSSRPPSPRTLLEGDEIKLNSVYLCAADAEEGADLRPDLLGVPVRHRVTGTVRRVHEFEGVITVVLEDERGVWVTSVPPSHRVQWVHETVDLDLGGDVVPVDVAVAPLVRALWAHGLRTDTSCEGSLVPDGAERDLDQYDCSVGFSTAEGALSFVQACLERGLGMEHNWKLAIRLRAIPPERPRGAVVAFPRELLERVTGLWG